MVWIGRWVGKVPSVDWTPLTKVSYPAGNRISSSHYTDSRIPPVGSYNGKRFVPRLRMPVALQCHHSSLITGGNAEKRYPETPAIFKNETTVSLLTKVLVSVTCNGLLYTEPGMPLPNPYRLSVATVLAQARLNRNLTFAPSVLAINDSSVQFGLILLSVPEM
jgi:hypothetical protein